MTKAEEHLKKTDHKLGSIISSIPSPEIERTQNVFHDLMSCVLEQQIHYRSTKKVFQKMLNKAELTELTPDNFAKFEENAFEGLKISAAKYETALNVIQYWEQQSAEWEDLSDEEVKKELASIKGIGKWTMDMILMYSLDRPNVFAYDDFHIKQIMTGLYGLDPKAKLRAQMKEIAEPWHPYLSTAFKYLLEWKKVNTTKTKK